MRTYIFFISAQRRELIIAENIINTPPKVGVPAFLIMCDSGPSFLIGWSKCFENFKYLIKGPPKKRTRLKEVKIATPVLNVMYLKTFKKLKSEDR